jgi:large exoprotein involved in heme utilization and adhesion
VADNLTDTAENLILDWINVVGTPTRPTSPLKCRLMTANGSDSSGGTEVTNSGGSTYASQNVTLATASGGATSNSGALTFANMPAVTVVGVEIWDSAGSPVRLWYGALTASKTVNLGDTFEIPTGDLDLTIG